MRIRMASDGNLMDPPGKFQKRWSKGTEIDCQQVEADALRQRGVSFSVVPEAKPSQRPAAAPKTEKKQAAKDK